MPRSSPTNGRGNEITIPRHSASGAYQTLAFVDRGKDIDVRDWSNTARINAALAVASQKWETLSINGTDEYKEKAASDSLPNTVQDEQSRTRG